MTLGDRRNAIRQLHQGMLVVCGGSFSRTNQTYKEMNFSYKTFCHGINETFMETFIVAFHHALSKYLLSRHAKVVALMSFLSREETFIPSLSKSLLNPSYV